MSMSVTWFLTSVWWWFRDGCRANSSTSGFQSELLGGLLAHLHLADLAGHRHRELVDHEDVARDLVVRELARGERAQLLGVERVGAAAQLDPRRQLLAVALVGDADHLHVLD